jgi:hypothetical protein
MPNLLASEATTGKEEIVPQTTITAFGRRREKRAGAPVSG